MIEVLEYYEQDGCMGGNRGLSVDFVSKTIQKWNSKKESFNESNKEDILFCIQQNIKENKQSLDKTQERLTQKETRVLNIEYGVAISEPPNLIQQNILKIRQDKLISEINELNALLTEYST